MDCDFLIIGAGIAGASAGAELATLGTTIILEREEAPGYHSTGRSAAMFTETYGPEPIRRLTTASGPFLRNPPSGFTDVPLLKTRGVLFLARPDQMTTLEGHEKAARSTGATVHRLDAKEMVRRLPILRPEYVGGGMIEPDASDLDVAALHQAYLRLFKARGGRLACDAEVTRIARRNGAWRAESKAGSFVAGAIVNAAGAWADEVARLAGLAPLGLVPKRRTAFTFDAPPGHDIAAWPLCYDVDEGFYFKPDAGRFLGSLADETPSPPCDAQPEELDVATAVDRIMTATTLDIRRLVRKWAGLRSFFADKVPVAGPSKDAPGFIWVAGQGGYGIQTSPAMGRIVAALAAGKDVPADIAATGLGAADLSPDRAMKH
jgi:D-arginine dehydrogenase